MFQAHRMLRKAVHVAGGAALRRRQRVPLASVATRAMSTADDARRQALVLWFNELGMGDVGLVGGKNASLGEMYRQLTPQGVRVPNGFAVTAAAYHKFIAEAGIGAHIRHIFEGLDVSDIGQLQSVGKEARGTILESQMPQQLVDEICAAYVAMEQEYGVNVDTAVRSSATAEDLPDASFAGQQETFLNITGEENLLASCRRCFASLFTDRAISYRTLKGFDHFDVGLSIGVQKMVRSDMASSGVMFSLDTESGFRDVVEVSGAWGLGENIVQGAVNPDEWYVFKPTLAQGKRPIISRKFGSKEKRMVYSDTPGEFVKNVPTTEAERRSYCLADDEILQLASWAATIEQHYSALRGTDTPMDIEWAKDGRTGELFIVQARPETVHSQADASKLYHFAMDTPGAPPIVEGSSVGAKIGAGEVNVIMETSGINSFTAGQVLVTEMTDPDWEPVLKKASAVVTNRGGRTCHAAIISRELGIPCVVGCGNATEVLKSGDKVTVDCSGGEVGKVYAGELPFHTTEVDLGTIPTTRTKIMMNLANPELAYGKSFIPNAGVGLARMEFIVNNYIAAHPLALLNPEGLPAPVQAQLAELTTGYNSGHDYFVDRLACGVGTLAAAFYPKPVILRFSDFKTNEYAHLLGGEPFEPEEDNPMLGWRGASRYYSEAYKPGFAMECEAVRKVREDFGLDNLVVMVPFCRTPEEGRRVIAEMEVNGLRREDGVKVYAMCEVPSNVICANEFLDVFDGFSIGSNDLTQLTLGVDRDSETVAPIYDERDPAVLTLIKQVVDACRARGKYVGICGQAPSDHEGFAEQLVEWGIESMSLNPDTVLEATLRVADKERSLS